MASSAAACSLSVSLAGLPPLLGSVCTPDSQGAIFQSMYNAALGLSCSELGKKRIEYEIAVVAIKAVEGRGR